MGLNFHGMDDRLELYALGRLGDTDLALLEEHLLICAACRERLNEIEDYAIAVRQALKTDPGVSPARINRFASLRWPAFALAVAAVALIGALAVFPGSRTRFAPAATLQLSAIRGEMPVAAPAREFDLTLADAPREGGPFRVEVVSGAGKALWHGITAGDAAVAEVKVKRRLASGDYFVRLYSASGQVLREYGFRIR